MAECVIKDVMTDNEIAQCREPERQAQQQPKKQKKEQRKEIDSPPPQKYIDNNKSYTSNAESNQHRQYDTTPIAKTNHRKSALDDAATGAIRGVALGIVAILIGIAFWGIKKLYESSIIVARSTLPKVAAAVKSGEEIAKAGIDAVAIAANEKIAQTKTCPFCAERIKSKAIVCRYCGHDIPSTQS